MSIEFAYTAENLAEAVEIEREEIEGKNKGLIKAASSIIFMILALALFQYPFELSFLPKALVIFKTIIIPESMFLLLIFGILMVHYSLVGMFFSIVKFNLRGLFISLFVFLFTIGVLSQGYEIYSSYEKSISKIEFTKVITLEDRSSAKRF